MTNPSLPRLQGVSAPRSVDLLPYPDPPSFCHLQLVSAPCSIGCFFRVLKNPSLYRPQDVSAPRLVSFFLS